MLGVVGLPRTLKPIIRWKTWNIPFPPKVFAFCFFSLECALAKMFLDFKKVFMLAFMKLLNIVEQNLSCNSMDNRGIYVLYMPPTTKTIVMVVNPFNNHEIIVTLPIPKCCMQPRSSQHKQLWSFLQSNLFYFATIPWPQTILTMVFRIMNSITTFYETNVIKTHFNPCYQVWNFELRKMYKWHKCVMH